MKNCLKEGDVFIDVGSCTGFLSLCASKFVGEKGLVYALEPLPSSFSLLQQICF